MHVTEAIIFVVILTCWADFSSVALPYSTQKRVENDRSFTKDISPGRGKASERRLNGNPSRQAGPPRSVDQGLGTAENKLRRRSSRKDVFVDFYESKKNRHASYSHQDNSDEIDDEECLQSDMDWSVDSDIMKHLTNVLLTGNLGQNNERRNKQRLASGPHFAGSLSQVTSQGTFLEIGDGVTSLHLSNDNKQSLITALIIPEPPRKKLLDLSKSFDAFIGSVSSRNIKSLVKSLVQDPEVFFGSILLSNLTALIGDNLPHEFEKLLGQVIILAKETYIASPSDDQYTTSYMNSWRTVQKLAERACSSLDVTCAISFMTAGLRESKTLTKVTLIEGQRLLTQQFCCGETLEDCSMTYSTVNGTEEVSIGVSQQREVRFQRTGLLLSTLLKLNIVGYSFEKLVVPLLEMVHNTERLARNILVTHKQIIIHSQLPSCQRKIYEKDRFQQERDISEILNGDKEKSPIANERRMPQTNNQHEQNMNTKVATSRAKGQRNSVLKSQQSNDQSLIINLHTEYANKDTANKNVHTVYANNDLNMHNDYANENGANNRLRDGGMESQKLTFKGEKDRQSIDKSKSAINNNQKAFKSAKELIESKEGKKDIADMKMNSVGLQNGLNQQDTNMNNMGLQNEINKADMNMNNMGPNGVDMMHWRKRNSAGWDGDDEDDDERQRDRVLEWERAREELDGYRGAGQGMMKNQVDMVADLWQRENVQVSDAKRNPEVPGSNWDRETDSRSFQDQPKSKLVAVGNLLLTRDEENPTVLQRSWETMKGAKMQEGLAGGGEGAGRQGIDTEPGDRGVSRKVRRPDKKDGAEESHPEGRTNDQGDQDQEPLRGGGTEGGIPSKITPLDEPAADLQARESDMRGNSLPVRGDSLPAKGNILPDRGNSLPDRGNSLPDRGDRVLVRGEGRAPRDGRFPKQRRKQFRQAETIQRKLLQYYDNDFAYNTEEKMRSDAINEPIEIQQELENRRRMIELVARQQEEEGEFPKWEELASAVEETVPEDDYYHDGSKVEGQGQEKSRFGKVEDYHDSEDAGVKQDGIEDGDDGWRGDAFQNRQVGGDDDDDDEGEKRHLRPNDGDAFQNRQVVHVGDDDGEDESRHLVADDDDDGDRDEEEEIGRKLKEMLKMKETEGEKIFDSMWDVLEPVFVEEERHVFSLFTYGGKELSLLSAKVSRSFPNASIVTVIPPGDDRIIKSHRKLQKSLQLTNNIVTQGELSRKIVFKLYQEMEYFRFQVLGLATFQKLVTYGTSFPSFLGHLLALSQTTFIEVPHPITLASLQFLLHSKGKSRDSIFKGFFSGSLEEAGVLDYRITVLNKVSLLNKARLVRVDIHAFNRQVTMDCSGSLAWFKQDASKLLSLAPLRSAAAGDFPVQIVGGAIRLQTLLSLGLQANERKLLFRDYLELAVHSDMCPMTILWQQGRLLYSPIIDSNIENPDQHIPCSDNRKTLVETMTKQLDTRPFSFMEYGTGEDGLAVTLATKYPNSTFILVTGSDDAAERRQDDLEKRNIKNVVVTRMGVHSTFTSNLVSSPDFMRYQYIGMSQLVAMITGDYRPSIKSMFGDIVSTGVTTFFQMPSAQILSLAVATLYPEVFCDFDIKDIYQASNHPSGVFKNYELRLLKENIELQSGQVNLSASMIQPSANPDGSQPGWSMVRIDVRQLNIMVDHHFMYVLDGHRRKYSLHCNSNASHYEVYLVRGHDGFKIPYQEVKGISLIALLRMGLMSEVKENFYNQFLKLPLYGDMAPWNILFSGGNLEYIDYDTKQFTFDNVAPAAYQIMAMLMNYRRTVDDFGHCDVDGRNPYGFSLISHCVGSKNEGTCTDDHFPVACADQTCRSTYIECLQALGEIEQKHSGVKAVEINTRRSKDTASKQTNGDIGNRLELSFKGPSRKEYEYKK